MDLDGTLVADLHTIPARTQAAVKAAAERNVWVTIATGREYQVTKKFIHLLGLTAPIICYQGALIYEPEKDHIIGSESLALPLAHQLIDLARLHQLTLNLYVDHKAYTEYLTGPGRALFGSLGTPLLEVPDLKAAITVSPIKGLIYHRADEAGAIVTELQAVFGDSLNVFRSLDTLIEITAPTVSKGRALATLADYYGIARQDVMAIGDQDNDIEMIAWAGLGVAMGNASPGAKAAADVIAPPVTEEGAAWAIERFILEDNVTGKRDHGE